MTAVNHLSYTNRRVAFLNDAVEQWKRDHDEASLCWELEQLVRDMTVLFRDVFALDARIQREIFDGRPFDAALDEMIGDLFRRGAVLADNGERLIADMERRGYDVDGAAEFRAAAHEVRSAGRPTDQLTAPVQAVRDAALAELAAGETDEWR